MTTQNDDMTETVVNAGDTVKTDDIELEAPKNAMATARRLFVQLGNQRVRLCVVAASILLFHVFPYRRSDVQRRRGGLDMGCRAGRMA